MTFALLLRVIVAATTSSICNKLTDGDDGTKDNNCETSNLID